MLNACRVHLFFQYWLLLSKLMHSPSFANISKKTYPVNRAFQCTCRQWTRQICVFLEKLLPCERRRACVHGHSPFPAPLAAVRCQTASTEDAPSLLLQNHPRWGFCSVFGLTTAVVCPAPCADVSQKAPEPSRTRSQECHQPCPCPGERRGGSKQGHGQRRGSELRSVLQTNDLQSRRFLNMQ